MAAVLLLGYLLAASALLFLAASLSKTLALIIAAILSLLVLACAARALIVRETVESRLAQLEKNN